MSEKIAKNKSHFLNKVAFIKHIKKIKNESVRNYFTSFFKVKNLLFKFLFLIVIGLIVMSSGFGIEMWYIKNAPEKIVLNSGVGFSIGQHFASWVVYLIQSLPICISFLAFIFIPNWWGVVGFLMMFFGGLSNIVDRALDFNIPSIGSSLNKVVDYVQFGATKINANDVWICIGVGFIVLAIVIWISLLFVQAKKEKQNEKLNNTNKINQNQDIEFISIDNQNQDNIELTIVFDNENQNLKKYVNDKIENNYLLSNFNQEENIILDEIIESQPIIEKNETKKTCPKKIVVSQNDNIELMITFDDNDNKSKIKRIHDVERDNIIETIEFLN